ncbi:unnamed protein product [Closterium sp. Naga37s-1]|nr:unnamed protein product [Closterium sp. Naga37s-1]
MPSPAIPCCFTCNAKDSHFPLLSFSPSLDSPPPLIRPLFAFSPSPHSPPPRILPFPPFSLLRRLNTQFLASFEAPLPLPEFSPAPHSPHPRVLPLFTFSHFTASHRIRWMPWRAEALARGELAGRPRPVVFMSFSGGYKACQWKIMEVVTFLTRHRCILQALLSTFAPEGMHRDATATGTAAALAPVPSSASPPSALPSKRESGEVSTSHRHFLSLLRECYAGQVFDSSPVDFTSDLGVRFLSQPPPVTAQPQATSQASATSQQPLPSQPPLTPQSTGSAPASAVATALAAATTPATPAPVAPAASAATAAQQPRTVRHTLVRSAAVVLDWLLLPEFEKQRAAQWATLLHCSPLAPVLLLCSTDDQLAPIEFIRTTSSAFPRPHVLFHPHAPSPPPAPGAGAAAVQHGRPAGSHWVHSPV